MKHNEMLAQMNRDSLGPLNLDEYEALLVNILWSINMRGAIDWEGVVAQTAISRRVVRDQVNLLAPGIAAASEPANTQPA